MQCPNCREAYHDKPDDWKSVQISSSKVSGLAFWCSLTVCPVCDDAIVKFTERRTNACGYTGGKSKLIYPLSTTAATVSSQVPEAVRVDYIEASNVLPVSPKASAALSRRVLQVILDSQGYHASNLAKQVDLVLGKTATNKMLPSGVRRKVDAVRNFGNFSAHAITDLTTLQVIDVEPEEAEWCLEIVSDLFEHYYIRPAADAKKLADLNQKLQQAGKPAAK